MEKERNDIDNDETKAIRYKIKLLLIDYISKSIKKSPYYLN